MEAHQTNKGGMAAQVAHRRQAAGIHRLCFCVSACIPDAGKRRTLGGAVGPVDSSRGASVREQKYPPDESSGRRRLPAAKNP